MKKVAIAGGPPSTVVPLQGTSSGATWGEDGTIVFAESQSATGLQRVSAAGGDPTMLTKPDRGAGNALTCGPSSCLAARRCCSRSFAHRQRSHSRTRGLRCWISGPACRRSSSVPAATRAMCRRGTLFTASGDAARRGIRPRTARGDRGACARARRPDDDRRGAADFAVSANGSLVYVAGEAGGGGLTVVSVDRQNRVSPLPGVPVDSYRDVRVSPDGDRLALATESDVWTYDFDRPRSAR